MTIAIILITYILPFLSPRVRAHGGMMAAYLLSVTVHHALAVANNNFVALAGATQDAEGFHMAAWQSLVGVEHYYQRHFYTKFLGAVYNEFGIDKLLGSSFSILAFSICLLVIAELISDLGIEKKQGLILGVTGLAPSPLIHTSITMREPYQMLFLAISCLMVTRVWQGRYIYIIFLIPTLGMLSRFHNGLSVLAVLFFLVALLGPLRNWIKQNVLAACTVGAVFMGVSIIGAATLGIFDESAALEAVASGGVTQYATYYREHQPDARTTYYAPHDFSTPFGTLLSVPALFFYYMAAPFPWQVGAVKDIYSLIENVFRIYLIYSSVIYFTRLRGDPKSAAGILLFMFLALEMLWSIGTANWGNALRHHSISLWMVTLLGLAPKPPKQEKTESEVANKSIRGRLKQRRKGTARRAARLNPSERVGRSTHRFKSD